MTKSVKLVIFWFFGRVISSATVFGNLFKTVVAHLTLLCCFWAGWVDDSGGERALSDPARAKLVLSFLKMR